MLKVNEIFGPTIQGEGKSVGMECSFLRLALCNLHCIWCDTPYTWNWKGTKFKHPDKYCKKSEVREMTVDDIVKHLDGCGTKNVVVSGGEPLMQQKKLGLLFRVLKNKGYWIEVETNGTIAPSEEMFFFVDQFNVSPKLSNSLDPQKLREKPKALEALSKNKKCNFKFVVSNEQDVTEVLELVSKYKLKQVCLMPLGKTRAELAKSMGLVQEFCRHYGFEFSNRLHILKWGEARGK